MQHEVRKETVLCVLQFYSLVSLVLSLYYFSDTEELFLLLLVLSLFWHWTAQTKYLCSLPVELLLSYIPFLLGMDYFLLVIFNLWHCQKCFIGHWFNVTLFLLPVFLASFHLEHISPLIYTFLFGFSDLMKHMRLYTTLLSHHWDCKHQPALVLISSLKWNSYLCLISIALSSSLWHHVLNSCWYSEVPDILYS